MHSRQVLYYMFYALGFALAVLSGLLGGFTDPHSPPAPFVIETFTVAIGIFLFLADFRKWRPVIVHEIGLGLNLAIIIYTVIITFA